MIRTDSITIQNYIATRGQLGQLVWDTPSGPPVTIDCNGYPLDASLVEAYGLQTIETRQIFADVWPGDVNSRIYFEQGEWDQAAPAEYFNKTSRPHYAVIIRRRS